MAGRRKTTQSPEPGPASAPLPTRTRPLVFISHDTRDADLAKAFGNLLTDASGGVLKSFRASDRRSSAGIEFGASWYSSIMNRLGDATDVVALLTENSLDRPWILYEAGVAKGKLDTVVFGVAIGVPLDRINIGPFAQFQNSADDEDSLTTLVLQLIQRIPDAEPREEAVRRQVGSFRENVEKLLRKRTATEQQPGDASGDGVAKLFEEVKVMVNDLTKKLESRSRDSSLPRARRAAATELTFLKGLLLDTVDQSGFGLLVATACSAKSSPGSTSSDWRPTTPCAPAGPARPTARSRPSAGRSPSPCRSGRRSTPRTEIC